MIKDWFKPREIVKFSVVEIEKPILAEETPATLAEVTSLASHTGFKYLVRKLARQAALLQAELNSSRNENNQDVYLKSGIFWCKWLQQQVDFSKQRYINMREPTPLERQSFEEISSTIERIGQPSADSTT